MGHYQNEADVDKIIIRIYLQSEINDFAKEIDICLVLINCNKGKANYYCFWAKLPGLLIMIMKEGFASPLNLVGLQTSFTSYKK